MRRLLLLLSCSLIAATPVAVLPSTATAQQASVEAPAPALDARAVVGEVRRVIAARYVVAERRAALDAVLAEGLASGRYDVAEPAVLAERINADLETVGRDRHLGFSLSPGQAAILSAQQNATAPDNSGFERQVRSANHGVTELRLLPGNVRYMAYDGFMWIGPESAVALETAMRFLVGGDAIIIDLRRNGGGDAEPSRYMLSHFMAPGQALYDYFEEGAGASTRISTMEEPLPAGRVIGKPLYLLTSGDTMSAAEEFTGNVKGFELGEIVGENTAGGGHPNAFVPIDGRFVLSVSVGRVVLASTGRDWEGVGFSPTIPTAAPQALDAAHAHALRRLAPTARAEDRPRLEAMAEGIAARVQPASPARPLTAYTGAFGERTVRMEDGKLYYRFGERPRRTMIPVGGDAFTLENDPALRIHFIPSGDSITAIEVVATPGRPPQGRYERTE